MRVRLIVLLCGTLLVLGACSSSGKTAKPTPSSEPTTTTTAAARPTLVFNGQGNDLAAYLGEPPFTKQIVVHHRDDDPPTASTSTVRSASTRSGPIDSSRVRTRSRTPPAIPVGESSTCRARRSAQLSVREVGKLVPTYQPSNDNPENYGCGFLSDGRILTTDVGNQASGPGDGQLIVWFPPFESRAVEYCKVNVKLTTAQGLLVSGDSVYVVQARPPAAGVYRYDGERSADVERAERRVRRKGCNRRADGHQRLVVAVHPAGPGQHARDAQRHRAGAERSALRVERHQRLDRRVHRAGQVRA